MSELSFIVYGAKWGPELSEHLERTGQARVLATLENPEELGAVIAASAPDALLLALHDADPMRVLDLVEALPAPRPLLLMAGPPHDSPLLLRAVRLGAREYFDSLPSVETLRSSLLRLRSERTPSERPEAPVVVLVGAKGGVGTTTVSCQLSAVLQCGATTALVDLDLIGGDVDLYLNVQPAYSLSDLKGDPDDLDPTYMRTLLVRHASGLSILAAPRRLEEAEQVRPANVRRAVDLLSRAFDWVVVDAPRTWDDSLVRILDRASLVLLVTTRQVPALHQTRRQLALCRALGLGEKLRLVVNRVSSRDSVSEADLRKFLDRGPDAVLPEEPATASLAADQGKTLMEVGKRTALTAAYLDLARKVHQWSALPLPAALQPPRRSGLLRWKGRRDGTA